MIDIQWTRNYTYATLGSLFFLVLIVSSAGNFTQGTVVDSEPGEIQANYSTGEVVEKRLAVSKPDNVVVDTNDDDGDVQYLYVKSLVLDDSGDMIWQSNWRQWDRDYYEAPIEHEFQNPGEKSYVALMATAESSYDYATGEWSDYNINEIDRTVYTFNVRDTPDAPTPESSLISFLNNLIDEILQLLS